MIAGDKSVEHAGRRSVRARGTGPRWVGLLEEDWEASIAWEILSDLSQKSVP